MKTSMYLRQIIIAGLVAAPAGFAAADSQTTRSDSRSNVEGLAGDTAQPTREDCQRVNNEDPNGNAGVVASTGQSKAGDDGSGVVAPDCTQVENFTPKNEQSKAGAQSETQTR